MSKTQFGIDVRLPGKSDEVTAFHDPQSAALYILMSYDIPLLEFVTWTLQERSLIINKPTAFSSNTWKFFLLQDQSVTELKEQIESATAAATTSTTLVKQPRLSVATAPPQPAQNIVEEPARLASPSPVVKNSSNTPPTTAASVSDDPLCRTRASTKRYSLSLSVAQQKSVVRCPIKRSSAFVASSATNARKRGSNRRIPEKENVTECPECGRKGQSIFDPSISDREGHVWQYFYCRNSMCAKGRSCNRYIGWAIRPLDR